jgi:hypothetical protein
MGSFSHPADFFGKILACPANPPEALHSNGSGRFLLYLHLFSSVAPRTAEQFSLLAVLLRHHPVRRPRPSQRIPQTTHRRLRPVHLFLYALGSLLILCRQ